MADDNIQHILGPAAFITLEISNWEQYGLTERTCYHFSKMKALDVPHKTMPCSSTILECVPTRPFRTRKQKRTYVKLLKRYPAAVQWSPTSRILYTYKATRITVVLDATPSIVSTFAVADSSKYCCAMDRFLHFNQIFWKAILENIQTLENKTWRPDVAVTLLAVYNNDETSLLVRDFRIEDLDAIQLLLKKVRIWCYGEVESHIANSMSTRSSRLGDLLDAGQAALSTLSESARPILVVATDGRCVDYFEKPKLEDLKVFVWDLSSDTDTNKLSPANRAFGDPSGAPFPLYLSDDREYLQKLGLVWDVSTMEEAARVHAGGDFIKQPDAAFEWKRHTFHPNAVQYYYLFQLSALSPRPNNNYMPQDITTTRATISNYIIHPVRIYEILLVRIKEGYNVKQYGKVHDGDQINIQFVLPLDMGTTIHYELIYRALPETKLVGVATIKIDLSGERLFIDEVKAEFMSGARPSSASQQVSARLCSHLRWIRKEDMLQSYLAPLKWSDQLTDSQTPFVRRLGTLTTFQRQRHFCSSEFDCVCTGNMPWEEDGFLSEFRDTDDGSKSLLETIENWSTQPIARGHSYIKRTDPEGGIASYCVLYITQARVASRLFTITIETFSGISAVNRLALAESLKEVLRALKKVEVLPKQIAKFLVGERVLQMTPPPQLYYQKALQSYHNHATWDLVKDPELLPLLVRRRKEIGKFHLLESTESHAMFAKLVISAKMSDDNPGDLVQYELAVHDDKIVVDLHMESEGGAEFFPLRTNADGGKQSRFHRTLWSLRRRDQERGLALSARTNLLRAFGDDPSADPLSYLSSVKRLLVYASTTSTKLRFFRQGGNVVANKQLQLLTSDLILSGSLGAKAAKLPITDVGGDLEPGDWYLVQYDKDTLSIVHLLNKGKPSDSGDDVSSYRTLTFFTIGISDLYTRKDDVLDDESDHDHISEHLQVSEFIESLQMYHLQNYALAAYLAMKKESTESLSQQEFGYVLDTLELVAVASASVESHGQKNLNSSLLSIFERVLRPVPGNSRYFYYEAPHENNLMFPIPDDIDSLTATEEGLRDELSHNDEAEDVATRPSTAREDESLTDDESFGMDSQLLDNVPASGLVSSPIFIAFLLNDDLLSASELELIDRSGTLSVLISVFGSNDSAPLVYRKADISELQVSHIGAALELSALLDAYIAENMLERLRSRGIEIQEPEIKEARRYLSKARTVETRVEVFFYLGKTDSIVSASVPSAGALSEVEEGFKLLENALRTSDTVSLLQFGGRSSFLVIDTGSAEQGLQYWCFLKIRKHLGTVVIQIHHPGGHDKAMELMNSILAMVYRACHHVNQLLVLRRLHGSRIASRLLLPSSEDKKKPDSKESHESADTVRDGFLACPVVYTMLLDLPHRCASNPKQVARTLESSVLHNFSVSNRRNVFVYKDESGSIFYLFLTASDASEDSETGISRGPKLELIVHGVDDPGPSVKLELKQLLQKRILQIAVDLFSAVLTNNPRYQWKRRDLNFVRSYDNSLSDLESETSNRRKPGRKTRKYVFPIFAYDPAMIVLFFRQNIFGSGFFHALVTPSSKVEVAAETDLSPDDTNLRLGSSEMLIYYNTSPTKLDPNFQSESTLTERGIKFSRKIGTGIAIIELSLQTPQGEELSEFRSAIPVQEATYQNTPAQALDFREYDPADTSVGVGDASTILVVNVTGTSLNLEILHQWVMLCIKQALASWAVERHLERMQKGLIPPASYGADNPPSDRQLARDKSLDTLCPGLPYLSSILASAQQIPHPAVLQLECGGSSRSSEVASFALELLERAVFEQIMLKTNKKLKVDEHKFLVVRFSRSSEPVRVSFERDERKGVFVRTFVGSEKRGRVIKDSPIECPEYIMLFYSADYSSGASLSEKTFPKLFEEVLLGSSYDVEKKAAPKSLEVFKQKHPDCFRHSFAFILSVKRNRRTLLAYNWNKELFGLTAARLQDIDGKYLDKHYKSVGFLGKRSLGLLAPIYETARPRGMESAKKEPPSEKSSDLSQKVPSDADKPPSGLSASAMRLLRRPKLVGKSVDGAAMQAVAMSRNRARAGTNKLRNSGAGGNTKNQYSANDRESEPTLNPRETPVEKLLAPTQEKAEISKLKNDLNLAAKKKVMRRQQLLRSSFMQRMIKSSWPSEPKQALSRSTAEFLFLCGPIVWSETVQLPPITAGLENVYIVSLANTISVWLPEFSVLSIKSSQNTDTTCFLYGKMRKVRSRRCFVVVRLSLSSIGGKAHVVSEGRVLTLPRKKQGNGVGLQFVAEKDSVGVDKLGHDVHSFLMLEGKVLDHVASVLERTMKSAAGTHAYNEVYNVLRQVVDICYPLRPMLSLRSNYKCFESRMLIRSYRDRLIDMFDAPSLFGWLKSQISERHLVDSGRNTICFKREIVVGSTHSICFWICDPKEAVAMHLLVLCRTQGTSLEDFMFREGSNVAITMLANILVEAAGLAYKELHYAAKFLYKERLWLTLSRSGNLMVSGAEIHELLGMCCVKPVLACLDSGPDSLKNVSWYKNSAPDDIIRCSIRMKSEPAFAPAREVKTTSGTPSKLFYLEREDAFLLIQNRGGTEMPLIDIVQLDETPNSSTRAKAAATVFLNFFLHFLWTEMMRRSEP